MMDKQEVQRRQWRLMGRTALWGAGVLVITAVILEANAPEDDSSPPEPLPPVAAARSVAKREAPAREVVVGGVYVTREGRFVVARDEASLRAALELTGPQGVFREHEIGELTLLGIEGFTRRYKVQVTGKSDDGRLVQIKVPDSDEVRWVTPAVLASVRDRDERWVHVGERYSVTGHGEVGAPTPEGAERVAEAVVAALPETQLTFPPPPRTKEEWAAAVRQVVGSRADLIPLPKGTTVEVIDIDMEKLLAAKVRVLETGAETWLLAMRLASAQE